MNFLTKAKSLSESLLPSFIHHSLLKYLKKYFNSKFFKQKTIEIQVGDFHISSPNGHSVIKFLKTQPYRNLCIGISAKFLSEKYPNKSIIDIGANIGDTAALIATYSSNKLILVEASDYFYSFLVCNAAKIPNKTLTQKVLVSDGNEVSGYFYHWGGTASFYEENENEYRLKTKRLSEIADEDVCFIKVDTDGYDFKILSNSIEWLSSAHPAILFEDCIRNSLDLEAANKLLLDLAKIGYAYFIVWDDPGYHIVSTTSLEILNNLHRYLFKVWQASDRKSICNFDVLCLHQDDKDIYEKIDNWYQVY